MQKTKTIVTPCANVPIYKQKRITLRLSIAVLVSNETRHYEVVINPSSIGIGLLSDNRSAQVEENLGFLSAI